MGIEILSLLKKKKKQVLKTMEIFPKNKSRITLRSSNSSFWYISKRIKFIISIKYFRIQIHSSTIHNSKVEATYELTDGRINKQNSVFTYHAILLRLKLKEILTHAITWMEPENIVLSEVSH